MMRTASTSRKPSATGDIRSQFPVTPDASGVLIWHMISIRRLLASILVGGFIIVLTAASASAETGNSDLAIAEQGLALGLQAVNEMVDREAGTVVVGEGLTTAKAALDSWADKHANSNRQGRGQGPVRAQAVHEALLNGDIPGQLNASADSNITGLARAYENMKAKADRIKTTAKPQGVGSDDGASEDSKSKDSKSEDD